jgi:acetoin utilization protein AcuB
VRNPAKVEGSQVVVTKLSRPPVLFNIIGSFFPRVLYINELKMRGELVKDWMTSDVVTISPETTVPDAHRLMTEKGIRRLPVLKDGQLVGIVTRGDVRGAEPSGATTLSMWELHYLLAKLKIKEIMTRNPITISQDATIGGAAQLMLDNRISGLPVVDRSGKVVGIITESDIFRMVVQQWS